MRKFSVLFLFVALASFVGCGEKTKPADVDAEDSLMMADPDTTLYGVCGEGTTMHNLEVVTIDGDTVSILIDDIDSDVSVVKGGLLAGDKMAVIVKNVDGEKYASKVINLTTLEGKWTSIDRNFEIIDGGDVVSTITSESNPYTTWKIHNGNLLLGRDTFDVLSLGADSIELENSRGIFVYKRQK